MLRVEEIDKFITVNRLIFKEEERNVNGDSEANTSENFVSAEKAEFIRNEKKVKNILFRVPEKYLMAAELED